MFQKYGNDAKLFNCSFDEIDFYCPYESFVKLPLCSSVCPLCNQPICYYCSSIAFNNNFFGDCCLKRRIYYKIFYDGFLYINLEEREKFKHDFLLFLSPICTLLIFICIIYTDFFYKLRKNKSEEYYDSDGDIIWFSRIINGLMAFLLTIIYIIHSFYFKVFLLVISIFTKNYPIKYYLGIIRGGKDHLDWI